MATVKIWTSLLPGILDPEAELFKQKLERRGIPVKKVRIFRVWEVEFEEEKGMEKWAQRIGKEYLTHPEVHTFWIEKE